MLGCVCFTRFMHCGFSGKHTQLGPRHFGPYSGSIWLCNLGRGLQCPGLYLQVNEKDAWQCTFIYCSDCATVGGGSDNGESMRVWWFFVCCCLVAKLFPTVCNPMDCNLPGSSVHEISQAIILEWVAVSFSRGFSQPRDWTRVSCIDSGFFTTRETQWGNQEMVNRFTNY